MRLLLLFCFCFISTGHAQRACLTPNNEAAKCVPVRHCPTFFRTVGTNSRVPTSTMDFIRSSTCHRTTEPWICCGSRLSYGPVNAARLQTPPNADPKQHRNSHLLPTECGVQDAENRVLGGTEAEINEFPWMAMLEYKDRNGNSTGFSCGGMLINTRYVLTAAHCVTQSALTQLGEVFRVRLGEHNVTTDEDSREKVEGRTRYTIYSKPRQDIEVEAVIAHPSYNLDRKQKYNDIALIRLKTPAKIAENVKPICLPINGEKSQPGKRLFVAGWGNTSNSTIYVRFSDVKMKVTLPLYSSEECREVFAKYGRTIQDSQFCAGGEANIDSCNGDSGGPIMTPQLGSLPPRWYAEGLVSYGPNPCGMIGIPGVYTRVSSYLNWILDNMV